MEGSTEEADRDAEGRIPQEVIAFAGAFGNERVDHFHRTVWKEENQWS